MTRISSLYNIFYNKLPAGLNDVLPVYNKCKLVTCLNPYYLVKLQPKDYSLYNHFDYIASDGMGPIILNRFFRRRKSIRLSFDLSSMAGPVFCDLINHDESLYVLGAKPEEIIKSVETIKRSFCNIKIAGYHHGYIQGEEEKVVQTIIRSGAKIVIIGMGAPLQDEMAIRLKESGFIGTVYTCGGFIHQTTEQIVSFPTWSNKLGLRWLYRLFTQKGMLGRLLQTYPIFVVTYSRFLLGLPQN